MVVDDHSDMRRVITSIIEKSITQPVQFIECESGEGAVDTYKTNRPDYVLMDYQLKQMNGFEAAEEIIKTDKEASIIMVTSYDSPLMRLKAEKLNFKGFITKDNLTEIVRYL